MAIYLKWSDYTAGSVNRIVANMFSYLSPRWYPVNILGTSIYKMLYMSADQLSSASTEINNTYNDLNIDEVRTTPVGSSNNTKIYENFGVLAQLLKQSNQDYETYNNDSGLQDYRTNLKLINEASNVATTQMGIDLINQSYLGVSPYIIDNQRSGYDGWCLSSQSGSVIAIGKGFIISDTSISRIGTILPTDISFAVGDTFKVTYTKLGHNTKLRSRQQFYNGLDIYIYSLINDLSFKDSIEESISKNIRADVVPRFFYKSDYLLSRATGSTYDSSYFEMKNSFLTNSIETTWGVYNNNHNIVSEVLDTSNMAYQSSGSAIDWTCLTKNDAYYDRYLRSYASSSIPDSVYYQLVSSEPIKWMAGEGDLSSAGSVSSINPIPYSAGSLYVVGNTLTVLGGSGDATVQVASASTLTFNISNIDVIPTAKGSLYEVDDILTLTGGSGDATVKVKTVSTASGSILSINSTPTVVGSKYITGDILTLTGGSGDATVQVASASTLTGLISAINSTTTASGSGYAVDDLITLTGGSGDAVAKILTVSSGGVQESFNITVDETSSSGSVASIYLLGYMGYSLTIGSGSSAVNTANAIVSKVNEGNKHIATNGTGSLPVVTLTSVLPGYYASGILCSYGDPVQTMSGSIINLGSGGGVSSVSLLSSGSSGYSVSTGNVTTGGSGSGCTIEITGIEASGGKIVSIASSPTASGTGYVVNDRLIVVGGSGDATVNVSAATNLIGKVSSIASAPTASGLLYVTGDILTLTGGSGDATVQVASASTLTGLISAINSTTTASGSGYAVDDLITLTGGSGDAVAKVLTVSSGGVQESFNITVNGTSSSGSIASIYLLGYTGYSLTIGSGSSAVNTANAIVSKINEGTKHIATNGTGSLPVVTLTSILPGYYASGILCSYSDPTQTMSGSIITLGSGGGVGSVSLLSSGSSGYSVSTGNVTTGGSGSGCTIEITGIEASGGGSIVDVNLLSSGSSGYSVSTGNVTTGGSGSGCTVNITGIEANGGGSATSVSLYYGGQSKYTVGSGNVTTGGSGSGCTVNITEVTPDVGLLGGVVSSISLLSSGSSGYSVSTGNVTTGGSGSGCTVNITGINKNTGGEVNLLELISEGSSGYSVSTGNVTTGGSGSGCTVNITEVKAISGGIVSEVTLLSSGSSGYVVNKRNITTGGSGSGCIIDITGINSIYSGIKGACGAHWVMLSSSSLWDISGNMNNLQKSSSSNNPIFEIGRSSDRLALSMNLVDHGVNSSLIYTGNTTNDIDSYAGLTAEFLINGVDKTFADGTGLIILKRETTSAAGTSLVGDGYLISIDSDEETFSYTAKSGSTTSVASASISTYLLEEPRRYHYFTVTCKNNKAKFFVDGEYISSGSITVNPQNISNSPTELYISNNNSSSYNIAIDEIMISPWASTPDSIKERFIQYAPRYIEPIIIASGSVDNYYQSKVSVFASGSGDFQYYGFALKAIEPRVFRSKDLSYYNLYKLPLEKT